MKKISLIFLLLCLMISQGFAQNIPSIIPKKNNATSTNLFENRFNKQKEKTNLIKKVELNQKLKMKRFKIYFNSYFYYFNNADLKSYNHDTYAEKQVSQDLNTDDQMKFIYSTIGIKTHIAFEKINLFIEFYRSGFWGKDNLEGKDGGGNSILFYELYFVYPFLDNLKLSFGRQVFKIGDAQEEYFFKDTIDGFSLNYQFNNFQFTFMADVLAIATKPDETYSYSGIDKDSEEIEDFEGETISARAGLMAKFSFIKFFSFFVHYGANSKGGADRSENGLNTKNEYDGDYLSLSGIRLNFNNIIDFTIAYSYGKDYLFDSEKKFSGLGINLNIQHKLNDKIKINLNSAFFTTNYCGMKASSMGSLLLYNYSGYFPTAYAGTYNFEDVDTNEKLFSKAFIKLSGKYENDRLLFSFSTLFLWRVKNDQENLLGYKTNYIGNELNSTFKMKFKSMEIGLQLGAFLPSNFFKNYDNEFSNLPSGNDIFYGGSFFVSLTLGD